MIAFHVGNEIPQRSSRAILLCFNSFFVKSQQHSICPADDEEYLHDQPELIFLFFVKLVEKGAVKVGEIVVATQIFEDSILHLQMLITRRCEIRDE